MATKISFFNLLRWFHGFMNCQVQVQVQVQVPGQV